MFLGVYFITETNEIPDEATESPTSDEEAPTQTTVLINKTLSTSKSETQGNSYQRALFLEPYLRASVDFESSPRVRRFSTTSRSTTPLGPPDEYRDSLESRAFRSKSPLRRSEYRNESRNESRNEISADLMNIIK